jgi:hypothetical protein
MKKKEEKQVLIGRALGWMGGAAVGVLVAHLGYKLAILTGEGMAVVEMLLGIAFTCIMLAGLVETLIGSEDYKNHVRK